MHDPVADLESARDFLRVADWFQRYNGQLTIRHYAKLLSCAERQNGEAFAQMLETLCARQRVPFPYHCLARMLSSFRVHPEPTAGYKPGAAALAKWKAVQEVL